MGPPSGRLCESLLQNFDSDLQDFYSVVIHKELKRKDKYYVEDIRQAITEIVEAYKKENTSISSSALRFCTKEKRCGYILKHSPCFTSAVAFHFMQFINDDDSMHILDAVLQKGQLSICCLGGGPASEIVAISKILGPLYRPYWAKNHQPLNLKATIVDINEDWKTTCEFVLETLKSSDSFDGVDAIHFDFQFLQADLSQPMCDDVKAVILNADILTMVYFVSAVNGGKDKEESFNMVKDIMKAVKTGGILFFLDSATDVHYEQMDRAARELGDMSVVYKPCIEYLHCLSLHSVKKFLNTYKDVYERYICMTNSFMSYCIWHKSKQSADNKKGQIENKELIKNSDELTQKMISYRREVNELCIKFGMKRLNSSEKWRENRQKEIENSRSWRDNGSQKVNRSESFRKTTLENHECSENGRNIDPKRAENWRNVNSKRPENCSEIESKKINRTGNWRENRLKEIESSENWRDRESQKVDKYENFRDMSPKNLGLSENGKSVDPKRAENWRNVDSRKPDDCRNFDSKKPENCSEIESKKIGKTGNGRENRLEEIDSSGNWRDNGSQKVDKCENFSEISSKNLERSENGRNTDPKGPENRKNFHPKRPENCGNVDPKKHLNWSDVTDSAPEGNPNCPAKCNSPSVLTNNTNAFDERSQKDFHPKEIDKPDKLKEIKQKTVKAPKWRGIESQKQPDKSEKWSERTHLVSRVNSNCSSEHKSQSVFTNNSNEIDEQNQYDLNPKNIDKAANPKEIDRKTRKRSNRTKFDLDHFVNWRRVVSLKQISLKKPADPDNYMEKTDSVSRGNSNHSSNGNPESTLTSNKNEFDGQNQYETLPECCLVK